MKRIMDGLLFGLLCICRMMPNEPASGEAKDDDKGGLKADIAKLVKEGEAAAWVERGKKLGLHVKAFMEKGEQVLREVLLSVAEQIGGKTEFAEEFLAGFQLAWDAEQTRKNRKSEAKAVLNAYAREGEVEMVMDARWADTTPAMLESAKKGNPEKQKRLAKDWLIAHKGGYHSFIALAKELAPRTTDASTKGSGTKRVTVLSDKAAEGITQDLKKASASQLFTLMNAAANETVGKPGFEVVLFRSIAETCNTIKAKSQDQAYVDLAAQMYDMASDMVERAMKAANAMAATAAIAKASTGNTGQVSVPAPAVDTAAPAQQPEKAAA